MAFPPERLRAWSQALGQATFVGSSGRVFPEAFKALSLLRAWPRRLDSEGVQFAFRQRWVRWDERGRLLFQQTDGRGTVEMRATVLAQGSASWPRLALTALGRMCLRPGVSRCRRCDRRIVDLSLRGLKTFRGRFEGQLLKGIAVIFKGQTIRGEAVITPNWD